MESEANEMMTLKLAALEAYLDRRTQTLARQHGKARKSGNNLLITQFISRKFENGLMVLFWDDLDKCKSPKDVIRVLERANVKTDIATEHTH